AAAGPIQRPRCQRLHCTDSTAVASAFLSASDEANGAASAGAVSHDVTPAMTATARIFQDLPMMDLQILCDVATLRQRRNWEYKSNSTPTCSVPRPYDTACQPGSQSRVKCELRDRRQRPRRCRRAPEMTVRTSQRRTPRDMHGKPRTPQLRRCPAPERALR